MNVIRFVAALFVYGIGLAFDETINKMEFFMTFLYLNFLFEILEITHGSICQKVVGDRRLSQIAEIFRHYARRSFPIDLLCLAVLAADVGSDWPGMRFLRLAFFLKTPEFFRRVTRLEHAFVTNFEREQYWGVVKVFLINFLMAHLLGVVLICLADGPENWMQAMGVAGRPWQEQYAYAYFWAMSTMLGFGNATPANAREAALISVIQCVSCILLAYIINHVGTLLSNIAKKNEAREKSLQTSRRLAEENHISEDLLSKINNYVRQTDSIEKRFSFEADRQFVGSLPADLKAEFLKESNKKIFKGLAFFKSLTEKTLMDLAERISVKIAHPQEVVFARKDPFRFLILKKGAVGFYAENIGRKLRDVPIDIVKVKNNDAAKLLSLSVFQADHT